MIGSAACLYDNRPDYEIRILAISGSMRQESYNTRLVEYVVNQAPRGVRITPYINLAEVPAYNPDEDGSEPPAPVEQLRNRIAEADGLMIVTPEYNRGIPGQLKNAIDWLSWPPGGAPLTGKPVAIAGSTITTSGTISAQLALRQILLATKSSVVQQPEVHIGEVHERFDTSGKLVDEVAQQLLCDLVDALVVMINDLRRLQRGLNGGPRATAAHFR